MVWVAEGEAASAWARALGSWDGGRAIKRDKKREVYRGALLGSQVAVKLQRFDGVWRSLRLVTGVGPFDEERERAGGQLLEVAGIAVAPMLACARAKMDGARVSVAVNEWLDGETLLERMASATDRESRRLASIAAGRVVGTMLKAGLVNRDHKPSNQIVISPENAGEVRLALIDLGGVRPEPYLERGAERMLSAMVLEPTGVGHPPTARDVAWCLRGLCGAVGRDGQTGRALRKELVRRVRAIVEAHGDPAPRVNPLEREG